MNDELPTEEGRQRILVIYSNLESLWHGLEGHLEGDIVEGPLAQYQTTLDELQELTNHDYDGFMPHTWSAEGGHLACHTRDFYAQVSSILGELRPTYAPGQVPHFIKESQSLAVSVSQYVNQEVNVTQELKVNIALELGRIEDTYEEGTPERNFITRLKEGLNSVKDIASLVGLIVTTAQAVGIGLDKLHTILTALKLA